MTDNVQQNLVDELNKLKNTIQKPNILLVGGTGVGKSSLLNLCFGSDFAKVGVGKPVTQYIEKFSDDNIPVIILDSKGYEIGTEKEAEFQKEVVQLCTDNSDGFENKPHLVWYCIQSIGARITDFDIATLREIQTSNIPTAIILTKSDLVSEEEAIQLKKVILAEFPNTPIFETSIKAELKGMELDKLINWSIAKLPEALKVSFISAQKRNIQEKREQAKKIILQHTTGSAFVGFSPIPFSDAPILLANQYALLARILYIYNLDGLESKFSALIKTVVAGALPLAGRFIVGQLLKFIPGLGTVAGGLINGSIAATITAAFGYAVSETCFRLSESNLQGSLGNVEKIMSNFDEDFIKIFKEMMKKGSEKNES